MNLEKLKETASKMVLAGKGLLAADESTGSIKKRFDKVGVESTEETHRVYRQMLFTAPEMEEYISGVILFDETIRQSTDDGTPFPKLLKEKGVIPGIKVDMKTHPLANFPDEVITEGLDGLREKLAEYKNLGVEFAKWRAVIKIGDKIPTSECIDANAHALSRYAGLCQEVDIVPIVEPEVLMDGNHNIGRCRDVTEKTLKAVFSELNKYRVEFEGMILKPNMVISGKDCGVQANSEEIAKQTIECFKETVPESVPGIVFLSGGQTPEEATVNLNAICSLGNQSWELSYSYGRALQSEALEAWSGKEENIENAQKAFVERAKKVSLARQGKYNGLSI